ncbi:Imm1 family immunity protein [Streptomyces caeruleatus]|uniref:Immunity protein Imm1 n=1 Tax=Streptomyces caeruleatus TaxID=661399 RepID=A0A101U490_9ACTN|nr:Imm1 family immunity protein [Streptomyces caeruleatus]KUO04015.1 hypothetical protein AQJ67_14835 [Streptomyces caeruleatus]
MGETWRYGDDAGPVTADGAVRLLRGRISGGLLETWLTSSSGRRLAVVSNGARAMVMLLDDEDDPGAHAADPGAEGQSGGYVLMNGQCDEYPDADTVPLAEALRIARHLLDSGTPPPEMPWAVDR